MISPYLTQILTITGINCIVALGWYIINLTGQFSVSQAAFMGIGAYVSALMTTKLGLPFGLAILAGGISSLLIGMLLSSIALELRLMNFAIATLGFGEAMVVILLNIDYLGGALGYRDIPIKTSLIWVSIILAVVIYSFIRFEHSRIGRSLRFIYDDPLVANCMGINVNLLKVFSFGVGAFLAGIGGSLLAHNLGFIEPRDLSFLKSIEFIIFVCVGGLETFWGALVGASVLTVLPELLRFSVYERYIYYGLSLTIMMIFRPKGLLVRTRYGN